MQEKLETMLKMQSVLDEHILQNNVDFKLSQERLKMAMIDEIGETTHELKGNWCWWKKTQKPVDQQKVLEELVDVWHFVLSFENHFGHGNYEHIDIDYINIVSNIYTLPQIISELINANFEIIKWCMVLTNKIGFTLDEVYEQYLIKNKENHDRQNRGY